MASWVSIILPMSLFPSIIENIQAVQTGVITVISSANSLRMIHAIFLLIATDFKSFDLGSLSKEIHD